MPDQSQVAGKRCVADEGVGIGVGIHPEQEPPASGARAQCLCGQTTGAQLLSADPVRLSPETRVRLLKYLSWHLIRLRCELSPL